MRHSDLLPMAVAPNQGESGQGFMLRMASSNGISLSRLRQLVGMTENETFSAKHENQLFGLVGLAGHTSSELLPRRLRGGGIICYGHRFRVKTLLRFRRPQVCPACIRETRCCAAHWDLSLSVLCLRHRCFLQDFCPKCHAAIRWNRPSIEWGHCKHYLGWVVAEEDIPQELISFQQITEDLLSDQEPDFSDLAFLCHGLSLDAWCNLLWAVGLMAGPNATPLRTVSAAAPSCVSARAILLRAAGRLQRAVNSGPNLSELAHVVTEAPLVGTILNPSNERDRSIVLTWYRLIFGGREEAMLIRRHRSLSQMNLF